MPPARKEDQLHPDHFEGREIIYFVHSPGLTLHKVLQENTAASGGRMQVIKRKDTARECTAAFFRAVELMLSAPPKSNSITELFIHAVGLKCGGRHSCFDMFWFAKVPDTIYAIDVRDANLVCIAKGIS
jgi:hypothetical protein